MTEVETAIDRRQGKNEVGVSGIIVEEVAAKPADEGTAQPAMRMPAVVPIKDGHFLVVAGKEAGTDRVLVLKSERRSEWLNAEEFAQWPDHTLFFRRQEPQQIGPKFWISQDEVWLGALETGGVHQHQVPIVNVGDAPLDIKEVHTSCGCTQARVVPTVLEPGEAGKILLAVDTRDVKTRKFEVFLTLETNMEQNAIQAIPVRAELTTPAGFDKRQFVLGDLPPTQTKVELHSTFRCMDCGSVEMEPVYLDRGLQWGKVEQLRDNQTKIHFSVDFLDVQSDADGKFECRMFVRPKLTDGKKVHEFVITGTKLPWIQASPPTVYAGRLRPHQQRRQTIDFRSFESGVPEVHIPVPEMIRAETVGPSTLAIVVTAPPTEGMFRTTVLLRVGTRSLNVPVVGVVNSVSHDPDKSVDDD